jgi:GNAT superfamily N-acetyltransferase
MVRRFKPEEISDVVTAFSAETASALAEIGSDLRMDNQFTAQSWHRLLAGGTGRAYGLFMDGALRGVLFGLIAPDTLSGELNGYECHWGVEKKYRPRAIGLLRAFEKDCKEAGCVRLVATATVGPTLEHMRKLYERLGYSPRAEAFGKKL